MGRGDGNIVGPELGDTVDFLSPTYILLFSLCYSACRCVLSSPVFRFDEPTSDLLRRLVSRLSVT